MLAVSLIERGGGRERCWPRPTASSAGPRSLDRVRLGPALWPSSPSSPDSSRRGTSRCRGRRRGDGPSGGVPGTGGRARERGPGPRAPPRSPASRRLVEGELETNVTMDAEDLLLRQFLGSARGGDSPGGELDPVEAAGRQDLGELLRRAAGPLNHHRGLRGAAPGRGRPGGGAHGPGPRSTSGAREAWSARVFTHMWLALFGQWSWDQIPALSQVIFLPEWFPLNIYDFACSAGRRSWRSRSWALLIESTARVLDRRAQDGIARAMASRLDLGGEVPAPGSRPSVVRAPPFPTSSPPRPGPSHRVDRSQAGGGRELGRIQPPWVYSLIALHLMGYPLDHSVMKAGLDGLDR